MNIISKITKATAEAVVSLFQTSLDQTTIQIQPTRKEFEGEFTIVVFPMVKLSRKSPEQTGEMLGAYLSENLEEIENFSVVKGFLNLKLQSSFWTQHLSNVLTQSDYGFQQPRSKGLVMVEYASPNTNKPLHLGHLRNVFLGYSVSEILKAAGHQVAKVQIINDRGIHICKSMVAWKNFGAGETPQSSGMKGDHLVGKYYVAFDKAYKKEIAGLMEVGLTKEQAENQAPLMLEARETLVKWEKNDPETYALWEKMNGWVYGGFQNTYERMGVDFDKLYYESNTWSLGKDVALKGVEKGIFTKRPDGSVWVDLKDEGMDEKLLLRSDGTSVYMTQDIGTAILRYEDFPEVEQMVYTVGNEQEYHFKVLFAVLQKLGYKWASHCHHLSYGMVELPEGKMKSREGTVVDADDIMEEMVTSAQEITESLGKLAGIDHQEREALYEMIGMAALKYFLLKVDPRKNMLFDPKESIDFNGHTGPFIQYAHARIQSILRKHDDKLSVEAQAVEMNSLERTLQLKIYQYPEVIQESAETYNPASLANYIFDLVKDFNSFYQNVSILQADTEELKIYRLQLVTVVGKIVNSGLKLLGIDAPDRM